MEFLQEKLPWLSKLLRNEVGSVADISNIPELASTPIARDKRSLNETNQPLTLNSRATKYSNLD